MVSSSSEIVDDVTVPVVLEVRFISVAVLPVSVLVSETSEVVWTGVTGISVSLTPVSSTKYKDHDDVVLKNEDFFLWNQHTSDKESNDLPSVLPKELVSTVLDSAGVVEVTVDRPRVVVEDVSVSTENSSVDKVDCSVSI